jgi:uncharacterized protein YigE (DUF2233 family)
MENSVEKKYYRDNKGRGWRNYTSTNTTALNSTGDTWEFFNSGIWIAGCDPRSVGLTIEETTEQDHIDNPYVKPKTVKIQMKDSSRKLMKRLFETAEESL